MLLKNVRIKRYINVTKKILKHSSFVMIFVSSTTDALSAKTAQVIQGTAPYFTQADKVGVEGARDYDKGNFIYFGVKFKGTTYSGMNDLNMAIKQSGFSAVDPNTTTPNQLLALLKSSYGLQGTILPFNPMLVADDRNNVGDDEGDIPIKINPPDAGLNIDWFYRSINQSFLLLESDRNRTFCELARLGWNPYIRISGPVVLVTEFGEPNFRVYASPKRDFFIYNAIRPTVCAAKPSIAYSFVFEGRDYTGEWAKLTWGENNEYTYDSGLVNKVRSKGFPTTGFDHAQFTLSFAGVPFDLSTISTSTNSNGVNLTTNLLKNNDIDDYLVNTSLQFHLTGKATDKPTFSIKSNGNEIYTFTINKWFATSDLNATSYDQSAQACQGNYVVPTIEDFTNSDQTIITSGACKSDNNSNNCLAINSNHYYRKVGKSLFAEWGDITNEQNQYYHAYPGNNFPKNILYWTSEERDTNHQYAVGPSIGAIEWLAKDEPINFVCVLK